MYCYIILQSPEQKRVGDEILSERCACAEENITQREHAERAFGWGADTGRT